MKLSGTVNGRISGGRKMSGRLSTVGSISGAISGGAPRNVYGGSYEVTPRTETPVVLETAKKYLEQDVTVLKVPFFQTSNEAGGATVYIGNEVI